MMIYCLRHRQQEELRRGSVTGEKVATYTRLTSKINDSGIIKLIRRPTSKTLCLCCLEELAEWLTGPNKHIK